MEARQPRLRTGGVQHDEPRVGSSGLTHAPAAAEEADGGAAHPQVAPAALSSQWPGSARALGTGRRAPRARAPPGGRGPARPVGGAAPTGGDRWRGGAGRGAARRPGGRTPRSQTAAQPGQQRPQSAAPAHRAMAPRARRRRSLPALLTICALLGPLQVRRPPGRSRTPRTRARARRLPGSSGRDPGAGTARRPGTWTEKQETAERGSRLGRWRDGKGDWRGIGAQSPESRDPSTRTRASKSPLCGRL